MNPKTNKQYLRSYSKCPYCNCDAPMSSDKPRIDCDYVTVDITCPVCEKNWTDLYKLTGYISYGDASGRTG